MSSLAIQPFSGTFRAQPEPSTFVFAVRHSGVFSFRGTFSDVAATLRADGDTLALEGRARVESISVAEPAAMRASVLGPQFFDAEDHPEITYCSTAIRFADDGRAEVDGELTIRGVTRTVSATGHYARPRQSGFGEIAGLHCGRPSTAASSDSTGRPSCRAVATPSAGTSNWTSICCSCVRKQMLTGDVLFVSGSLRRGSYNTALLREAANLLPGGVEHVWLTGIAALPAYNEDDDGERAPVAVERLRRTIAAAAAVLIATPEHNGSTPGALKNAVDWASRPFPDNAWRGKPVAVIGASTGIFGAVWAQAQLRAALEIAGASVMPAELAVGNAHEAFLPTGGLRDPALATGLRDAVAALVAPHNVYTDLEEHQHAHRPGSRKRSDVQALP